MGKVMSKIPVIGKPLTRVLMGKKDPGQAAETVDTASPEAMRPLRMQWRGLNPFLAKTLKGLRRPRLRNK